MVKSFGINITAPPHMIMENNVYVVSDYAVVTFLSLYAYSILLNVEYIYVCGVQCCIFAIFIVIIYLCCVQ